MIIKLLPKKLLSSFLKPMKFLIIDEIGETNDHIQAEAGQTTHHVMVK
jgi:hypothetical protein